MGVWDFKYVVVSDPLLLGHVIRRMRSDHICSAAKVNEERFAYFLTADEAIITKLDTNIKQIKIYTNF